MKHRRELIVLCVCVACVCAEREISTGKELLTISRTDKKTWSLMILSFENGQGIIGIWS